MPAIRVFRNLPRTDPDRRTFGAERIGRLRFYWIGPIIVIRGL